MKDQEKLKRISWIIEYITKNNNLDVDILNQYFSDKYINNFNPKYKPEKYGAFKCRELGQILSYGYHMGKLIRVPVGISFHETGFPNWVYCYNIIP